MVSGAVIMLVLLALCTSSGYMLLRVSGELYEEQETILWYWPTLLGAVGMVALGLLSIQGGIAGSQLASAPVWTKQAFAYLCWLIAAWMVCMAFVKVVRTRVGKVMLTLTQGDPKPKG